MLVNTLRWRESFNIEAALKEDFPEEVFGKLGYIYGKDKGGRPVAYEIIQSSCVFKTNLSQVTISMAEIPTSKRFLEMFNDLFGRFCQILVINATDFTIYKMARSIHGEERSSPGFR